MDIRGDEVLMDEIRLSKSSCWFIVAGVIILNFVFLFAAVTWLGRDRQAELNAAQIEEAREDMKAVSNQLTELRNTLANQAIKDAEIKGRDFGYRVGKTDGAKGH
jgi:hypothetical protein